MWERLRTFARWVGTFLVVMFTVLLLPQSAHASTTPAGTWDARSSWSETGSLVVGAGPSWSSRSAPASLSEAPPAQPSSTSSLSSEESASTDVEPSAVESSETSTGALMNDEPEPTQGPTSTDTPTDSTPEEPTPEATPQEPPTETPTTVPPEYIYQRDRALLWGLGLLVMVATAHTVASFRR
jgi:hypothetical protein